MLELSRYGEPVATVFDLLKADERGITAAVGWALANSPSFAAVVARAIDPDGASDVDGVRLEQPVAGAGFTDIELLTRGEYLVLEAKRGWDLPNRDQLEKYATRTDPPPRAIGVVSEGSREFAAGQIPNEVASVPVRYLPWSELAHLAADRASRVRSHAEKRALREVVRYLRGVGHVQAIQSNRVYVVSLGRTILDSDFSWRDVVLEHDLYFCPVGVRGWPKEPPNYLGFRFDGRLQQVRHVESYEVTENNYAGYEPIREKVDLGVERRWLFRLGPPIVPSHEVRTGRITWSARCWVALDLLLTSETISDARDQTKARLEAAGA